MGQALLPRREGDIVIPPEGFGLVFMGGGAKGAYQLGVWQALREMDIPIQAVTGASIGSINGALLAQGDFQAALDAWHSVRMSQIVKADGISDATENLLDPRNLAAITREMIMRRGLDNTPLRDTLAAILDEDRIRASGIDYGMTTFSKTDLSTTEIFVGEIPQGQLIDFIMASACFPIFKSVQIGEHEFIDGGIGDNMPVRMLLRRGCRHIITVDIGGVGLVRPVRPDGATIITVKYSMPLGGLFDLSPETLAFNQALGYLDTMKVFGRMQGRYYFFPRAQYGRMTAHFSRYTCEGLEEAALLYGLKRDRSYSAEEFFDGLLEAFEREQPRFEQKLESPAYRNILRELKNGGGLTGSLDGPMRLHTAME
ncbi:MAG: patatin-like phospholipase family protein, partial [Christensenellaceae bacterium]